MRSLAILCTMVVFIIGTSCGKPNYHKYTQPHSFSAPIEAPHMGTLSVPIECISVEEFKHLHGYFIYLQTIKTD